MHLHQVAHDIGAITCMYERQDNGLPEKETERRMPAEGGGVQMLMVGLPGTPTVLQAAPCLSLVKEAAEGERFSADPAGFGEAAAVAAAAFAATGHSHWTVSSAKNAAKQLWSVMVRPPVSCGSRAGLAGSGAAAAASEAEAGACS